VLELRHILSVPRVRNTDEDAGNAQPLESLGKQDLALACLDSPDAKDELVRQLRRSRHRVVPGGAIRDYHRTPCGNAIFLGDRLALEVRSERPCIGPLEQTDLSGLDSTDELPKRVPPETR
jgi:hypothetical protein